ncbi:putative histidinol-phosphatase [Erysipelotrichaceae bacterium]|nr:putative histidinol-phosphatase [Erysipelotrichaceae bacterium]
MHDYHLHTKASFDCNSSAEKMIEGAIAKGLEAICITDHYDFNYPCGDDFTLDIPSYVKLIKTMQKKYAGKITIFCGIEIGMDLMYEKEIKALLMSYKFDYIIGSVHVISGTEFYYADFFLNKTKFEANLQYFEAVLSCLQHFPEVNTLGHIDYISRYGENEKGQICYQDYAEILDAILRELITSNRNLEINTSGLRQGVGVCFPDADILQRYAELGGKKVVCGSDAHYPCDVGANFLEAGKLVTDYGLILVEITA